MQQRDWSRRSLLAAAASGAATTAAAGVGSPAGFAKAPGGRASHDHAAFDRLLARRTTLRNGLVRVDYAGWAASSADRGALKAYIAGLTAAAPERLTRPEQFAFWANLYNALTLDIVLAAWPVKSIRDIRPSLLSSGPWKAPAATVSGVSLSLDDIEHGILRAGWRDPRVHYAVNCASMGCPNLPRTAWRGEGLSNRLNAAARAFVNHPRGVRFDGDALVVSSIYHWFAKDFGAVDARVITHLATYADPALKTRLEATGRISRHDYDWSINDGKS